MIHVYTKERHVKKINNFLNSFEGDYKIFTSIENQSSDSLDLGISYCFPKIIKEPYLSSPKFGFINFHPGPLPKYKGPNEYEMAIENKEINWGVSAHYMNEKIDDGELIKIMKIELHEPPTSISELGAISHYFLFKLFKEVITEFIKKNKTKD